MNLQKVVEDKYSKGVASVLDANYRTKDWEPILIKQDNVSGFVYSQMTLTDTMILEGPPGTGKTYMIAELCARLCAEGHSVLVTALTNRALMEIAEKPAVESLLEEHKIFKTNISMDEIRELVERKKNSKRQNTSYIGVKDSALPTEDGPMQPQNFDQRMAEAASRSSTSELLDDIRRVEEQRKKDIAESQEMKAHYENNRKSKYERKQNFKQNNKQNNHRNNNRREERKDKLDMNSLDDIIGDMFK
jgi:SpoVK/Ycf46/Vps4 family AAA+-type ATPase